MRTKVILHVSTALHRIRTQVTFEFLEELLVILAHDVDKHVEATTVRHTEDHAVHPVIS